MSIVSQKQLPFTVSKELSTKQLDVALAYMLDLSGVTDNDQ